MPESQPLRWLFFAPDARVSARLLRRADDTETQRALLRRGGRSDAQSQRTVSTRITAAPNSSSQALALALGQTARPAWAGTGDGGSAAAMRWASAPVGKTR